MRSRNGQRVGSLVAAMVGAAWIVGACTMVVPLAGVDQPDAATTPTPAGPDRDGAPPPSRPDASTPGDAQPSPGDDGGPMCFDQPIPLQVVPPQAIIAFDRSSTMVDSRVEAVRVQLTAALSLVDKAVQFGYLEFPDPKCDITLQMCCAASDVLVAPARSTGATIGKQLACNANGRTCGSTGPRRTPTGDALTRINDYYRMHTPPGAPDQFAVVITDGEPNCGGKDGVCRDARNAAEHLWLDGVKTAILGVGIDASPNVNVCLSQIAENGGSVFRPINGGQGPAYPWALETDTVRLKQAIDQLLTVIKTRACVIKLAGPRAHDSEVTVSIKGAAVKFDQSHGDGWDFESSRKVRIWGSKCDDIQAGRTDPKDVQAVVMCQVCGDKLDCR
jgi:hypothetical protein